MRITYKTNKKKERNKEEKEERRETKRGKVTLKRENNSLVRIKFN